MTVDHASMRPPEFTGGNGGRTLKSLPLYGIASMRPPEFTGGNLVQCDADGANCLNASMRPPEFTGGNEPATQVVSPGVVASMRPPEFTGGNRSRRGRGGQARPRFNEAAGIHRRKHRPFVFGRAALERASMRPPEFTGGNVSHNSP